MHLSLFSKYFFFPCFFIDINLIVFIKYKQSYNFMATKGLWVHVLV